MPRLIAAEHVYSGDCYNEYVTSPPIAQHNNKTTSMVHQISVQDKSPIDMPSKYSHQKNAKLTEQHQIHTISSSDDDDKYVTEQTIEDVITNVSSNESGDFEGFDDDFTTANCSGLIHDASQEDPNLSRSYSKRFSNTGYNNYFEDSEGIVEPIEVDDDEEISIGYDENYVYQSQEEEISPKLSKKNECEPLTPNTRKKPDNNDHHCNDTPLDHIVEVNSDSTTNSIKKKRQQINNKYKINLSQQQLYKFNNNANRCSTESTSEFPVSSPSNPQQPRGGKYLQRPPLLKNTLPADSFERQLAMIATCNPQMTLFEKIQSWDCDDELSDVEDVNMFDEEFKRMEKQNKLDLKQREKSGRLKNKEIKNYDFLTFRQNILSTMKEQKKQKLNVNLQGISAISAFGKCLETSESESSKSVIHIDERPSTSAVAQQQLQQRRSKMQVNLETAELKRRPVKEASKTNQNSTTPPQTSSSDNERDFFQNAKNQTGQNFELEKVLCPSSSEEAVSQDVPSHILLKSSNNIVQVNSKHLNKKSPNRPLPPPTKINEQKSLAKNLHILNDEEIDSVFRFHRLNRERDKQNISSSNKNEEKSNSIIKMHLDFANENKTELVMEKKQELFKTPIVPQKYLANLSLISDNLRQTNTTPTKSQESSEKENCTKLNSTTVETEVKSNLSFEKTDKNSENDDIDGVYHQQHEFCNYLGLTGMSTATAMANAVAELAQCNLARRSMRVLRQKQERKDKTAKDGRQLENLKPKKQADIRKRRSESIDNVSQLETYRTGTVIKSEECSYSQTSDGTTSFKESKKKTSNNSATKSSTISQNSVTIVKRDPEIKILCHISTNKREETDAIYKECIKEITQPIRETLMRRVKKNKSAKLSEVCEDSMPEQIEKNEDKINNKNCELIGNEMKADRYGKIELSEKMSSLGNQSPHSYEVKDENIAEPNLKTQSVYQFVKVKNVNNIDKDMNDNGDKNLFKKTIDFIPPTPSIIQQKIKIALEESRKSKPSIFIVQSLETKKDISKKLIESKDNTSVPITGKLSAQDELKTTTKYSSDVSGKIRKKRVRKNMFKKGITKKYPTFKRQLRNRKIIVIKTAKPTQNSHPYLTEFKRELRSSPKTKEVNEKDGNVDNEREYNKTTKSYRTVHTETNDLEQFFNSHSNNKTKTRLMTKASALLERSKRMSQRYRNNATTINKSTLIPKVQRSKLILHGTKTKHLKPSTERLSSFLGGNSTSNYKKVKSQLRTSSVSEKKKEKQIIQTSPNLTDNDNVVVSSTTNTYDERPSPEALITQTSITLKPLHNSVSYVNAQSPIETKEQFTQCNITNGIKYLNNSTTPAPTQSMRNPLKSDYGQVLYIYNELEILIVIQERLVSFWKCSKLVNILTLFPPNKNNHQTNSVITSPKEHKFENSFNHQEVRQPALSSNVVVEDVNTCGGWIKLGELRRLNIDTEISVPYENRICLHNSTPIYLEMRAHELPKNHRDCNLISMYINIYYYHDEDMIAKCNSIQLDAIQSNINSVNYTTLIDSRYFILTWPQQNLLGKTRSGLCKYSLTPQLDTLASIREFKNMRHTIRYLKCMSDDKLIGFGDTQVTIWDHRSGDVLMNFDLEIPIGKNLGAIYFSSQDLEQNNMLILHQCREFENSTTPPVLMTIACTITHNQPSYRVLQEINLPVPDFEIIKCAINTGDYLIVTGQNDNELWISATNPTSIAFIPKTTQKSKRFYNRERSQIIELTEETLNVNSLASYVLRLAAAGQVFN